MIPARAEVERNTNNAADADRKEVRLVVELDQFKTILTGYEQPLIEMRDSL